MRPGTRQLPALGREIAVVLAAKTVALIVIYFAFFASPPRFPDVARHLFTQGIRP
jgi:hypothetical protein